MYTYMPTQRATKGARTPGTWLTTLDSNEGTGMNSRVPATLVSRTAKATFLVAASALVLGTQEAMNIHQINQGIVLKVTDLISLKCTVRSTFPEAYFTQGHVALGKPWSICREWAHSSIRAELCDPVLEFHGD